MDQRPIKRGSDAVVPSCGYTCCEANAVSASSKRQRQTGNNNLNPPFNLSLYYPPPSADFLGTHDVFGLQHGLADPLVFGGSGEIAGNFGLTPDLGFEFSGTPPFPTAFDCNPLDPFEMLVRNVQYETGTAGCDAELTIPSGPSHIPRVHDNSNGVFQEIGDLNQAIGLLPLWSPTFTAVTNPTATEAPWGAAIDDGEVFDAQQQGYHASLYPSTTFLPDVSVARRGIVTEAPLYRAGPSQGASQHPNPVPHITTPLDSLAYSVTSFPFRPVAGNGQEGNQLVEFSPPTIQHPLSADNWVHTSPDSDLFKRTHDSNSIDEARAPKKLGRTKGLDAQQAQNAAKVRENGACIRCKSLKVKCSQILPCEHCRRSLSSGLARAICRSFSMEGFVDTLFPLGSEYGETAVENLNREVIATLCNNEIEIHVGHGPKYPLITVNVQQYRPTSEETLGLARISGDPKGECNPEFAVTYAVPFALTKSAKQALRDKCIENMEATMKCPRYEGELKFKETSIVPWDTYHSITKYWRMTGDSDISRAMKLYATQYYMMENIQLCKESARKAQQSLPRPVKVEYAFDLPSTVITAQIKHEMFKLLREIAASILKNIAEISARKLSWAPTVCGILILGMCVEMVQVDIDMVVVREMEKEGKSRDASINQCQELDFIIDFCIKAFHKGFKSHRKGGFNPIRDGLDADGGSDAALVQLVDEFRGIIRKHEREMKERIKTPCFDYQPSDLDDLVSNHLRFRERNPGRVVSKIFHSFSK